MAAAKSATKPPSALKKWLMNHLLWLLAAQFGLGFILLLVGMVKLTGGSGGGVYVIASSLVAVLTVVFNVFLLTRIP
jgi:hypothetical protein